jgi:hypothetical protein
MTARLVILAFVATCLLAAPPAGAAMVGEQFR